MTEAELAKQTPEFQGGYQAYLNGRKLHDNPWKNLKSHRRWANGWHQARLDDDEAFLESLLCGNTRKQK